MAAELYRGLKHHEGFVTKQAEKLLTSSQIKVKVEDAIQNSFGQNLSDYRFHKLLELYSDKNTKLQPKPHPVVKVVPDDVREREYEKNIIAKFVRKLSTDPTKVDESINQKTFSEIDTDSIVSRELRRCLWEDGVKTNIKVGASGHTSLRTIGREGEIIIDATFGKFYPDHKETFVGTQDELREIIKSHRNPSYIREEKGLIKKTNIDIESRAEEFFQENWGDTSQPTEK